MSTTLVLTPSAQLAFDYESVLAYGNAILAPPPTQFTPSPYTTGTGANQCDRIFISMGTIAASSSTTFTLTNFLDQFSNTYSMLRMKFLWVSNLVVGTPAVSMLVGNATNPVANWVTPATAALRVRAGGLLDWHGGQDAVGAVIVPSTGDQIKLANEDSVNTLNYFFCVAGCSA